MTPDQIRAIVALEIIKSARELISDPERWSQGWYARDKRGDWTNFNSPTACKWCAMGAIRKMANADYEGYCVYLFALVGGAWELDDFNDNHTHAEVLALFDKAIAKLEGGL